MRMFDDILATVGNTPLVRLNVVTKGLKPLVLAKLESFNPGRSNKDRVGIHIVEMAEKDGSLRPGGTIVEATSGNTGLGLAIAAVVKGYKCICVMPDKVGQEKRDLLKAHGARVVITPTSAPPGSPERYTEVAKRLAGEIPGGFLANQYFNPRNPEIHYLTTGPEIWRDTAGRVTCYVASVGTGGSTSGAGKYLKEKNPAVRVVGVEPVGLDPRRVQADGEDRPVGPVPRGGDRPGDHPRQRLVRRHRRVPRRSRTASRFTSCGASRAKRASSSAARPGPRSRGR